MNVLRTFLCTKQMQFRREFKFKKIFNFKCFGLEYWN